MTWEVYRKQRVDKNPQAHKTHCKRGHPLSGPNMRIMADGKRVCLTCRRWRERRLRAKRA